jgi:hypothetical protein
VTDLQKTLHILVVSVFALTGISFLLSAMGFAWNLRTIAGPYFRSELDIFGGIAFLLAAAGLHRFDSRVRFFAMVLAGWILFAMAAALYVAPGLIPALWLGAWLFVLLWLFSSAVRAQFVAAKVHSKTA